METPRQLQFYPENRQGRDFFVGDIHGCYNVLMEALERVGFDRDRDRLFSVGDLVDRGPDSLACLSLPLEPWFHAVWGNHEEMMCEGLFRGDDGLWIMNGGDWILGENRTRAREAASKALERMPLAMEVFHPGGRIGVIHADVSSGEWGDFVPERDIWSRRRLTGPASGQVAGIDVVAVGHSVIDSVTRRDNVVYLDTGAVFGGDLTLLEAGELLTLVGG